MRPGSDAVGIYEPAAGHQRRRLQARRRETVDFPSDALRGVRQFRRIMDVDRLVLGSRRRAGEGLITRTNRVGGLGAGISQNKEFAGIGKKLRTSVQCDRLCGGRTNLSDNAHRGRVRRKHGALGGVPVGISLIVGLLQFLNGTAVRRIELGGDPGRSISRLFSIRPRFQWFFLNANDVRGMVLKIVLTFAGTFPGSKLAYWPGFIH